MRDYGFFWAFQAKTDSSTVIFVANILASLTPSSNQNKDELIDELEVLFLNREYPNGFYTQLSFFFSFTSLFRYGIWSKQRSPRLVFWLRWCMGSCWYRKLPTRNSCINAIHFKRFFLFICLSKIFCIAYEMTVF